MLTRKLNLKTQPMQMIQWNRSSLLPQPTPASSACSVGTEGLSSLPSPPSPSHPPIAKEFDGHVVSRLARRQRQCSLALRSTPPEQRLGTDSSYMSSTTTSRTSFKTSVNAALRDRGDEARPVIIAELKQMMDKQIWHGVLVSHLTRNERDKIIRCCMFL